MYQRKKDKAPESIIENGRTNWGTYNELIKNVHLKDIKRPFGIPLPKSFVNLRLKEWQAFQAGNKDWFIFGAVYNAKLTGIIILSVYHIKSGTKHHYQKIVFPKKIKNAQGLIDSETKYISKDLSLTFENELKNNKIFITCYGNSKTLPQIELGLECFHNTEPIVVSQPFTKKRGMYSHKALMKVKGNLKIENQVIPFSPDDSYCIMDDHKGFYPYKMNYDWITSAGFAHDKLIGFNLTCNQVIENEKYNENCIWHDGKMYTLPPIKFQRTANTWFIKDDYGMVNLKFIPKSRNDIKMNFGIIKTDYEGPFGTFEGIIHHPELGEIDFLDFFGMGEKKINRI